MSEPGIGGLSARRPWLQLLTSRLLEQALGHRATARKPSFAGWLPGNPRALIWGFGARYPSQDPKVLAARHSPHWLPTCHHTHKARPGDTSWQAAMAPAT